MILQITNGSIDAAWVLVVLAGICGTLALLWLNDIRSSIKSIAVRQNEQGERLVKNEANTEFAHERIDELNAKVKPI